MRKLKLYPADLCRNTIPQKDALALLTATGSFQPGRHICWFPIQGHLLTQDSINETNAVFRALRRGMLHSMKNMRRTCAGHEDAKISGCWCETYVFSIPGGINDYRLRCMIHRGDPNFVFTAYERTLDARKGAA